MSYIVSELIAIGGTVIFTILLGTILLLIPDEAQGSFTVNIPSFFVSFILFYFTFAKKHLYSDRARQRDLLYHTKENFSLVSALQYDLKTNGIYDILYYSICFLPLAIGWWGGPEGSILWYWGKGLSQFGYTHWWARYAFQVPMFILCYIVCLIIVVKIWDKNRPDYLSKGFKERENL